MAQAEQDPSPEDAPKSSCLRVSCVKYVITEIRTLPPNRPATGAQTSNATTAATLGASPRTVPPDAFNISSVTDDDMPKQVTLRAPETFSITGSSNTVAVPAGARADVIARSVDMLTLRLVNAQKQLPYTRTSFVEDVKALRMRRAQIEQARKDQLAREQKARHDAAAAKSAAERAQLKSEIGDKPVNSPWDGSVREIKSFMEGHLKDPKSTEYIEWSPVVLAELKDGKAWAVRVEYRSKNSFGGYVIEEDVAFIRHGQVVSYQSLGE